MLITIVKSPGAVAIAETSKSVGKNGASIGRGRDNSWVLPDPERYMSSLHTEIVFKDDKYYAVDHSTNGTFHNDTSTEIGKDNQVELKDGDRLIIGDYEIEVSMVEEVSPAQEAQPGPFAAAPVDDLIAPAASSTPDPLEQNPVPMANEPFSMGVSQSINNDQPLFPNEEVLDPLVALSSSEDIGDMYHAPEQAPFTPQDGLINGGTQGDSENMLSHSIQFPEMIPDNWFDMPLPDIDEQVERVEVAVTEMNYSPQQEHSHRLRSELGLGPNVGKTSPLREPVNTSEPAYDADEEMPAVVTPAPVRKPKPRVAKRDVPAEAAAEIQKIRQNSQQKQVKQKKVANKKPVVSISANEDLIAAMGLNIQDMSEEQIENINNIVAEFLQVSVKGLMLILKSRSTLKNEFRMSVTTIQSAENNPLKFSPTLEDAMVNMFVRSGNAYIDPVTAIKEGIESVSDHQFAVFAGMRSAFNHLLERFNPEILEAKFNKHKSSLLATKKARNWDLFSSFYEDIIKDRDDSFQYLFGDEFVQAYEQQMQQLKLTRSNQKK